MVGGGSTGDLQASTEMSTVWKEGGMQRGQIWSSTYPQIAKYNEVYCDMGSCCR